MTTIKPIEITVKTTRRFYPLFLRVAAEVRYWEDGTINGVEDEEGTLVPLRVADAWMPCIELATGRVLQWPEGTTAAVHYKVCDAGEYWLVDSDGSRLKWKGDYVPTNLLCVGENGHGDYIILTIGADGMIAGWKAPTLDGEEWEVCK